MMVGRFVATVYELVAHDTAPHRFVATASRADLEGLTPLLVPRVDHVRRLADGDLCLYLTDEAGRPVGLLWLNVRTHVDRHLGRWSDVSDSVAYYNQLLVAPAARRAGVASSLVLAAAHAAACAGRTRLRAAVVAPNPASDALHRKLGFRPLTRLFGVRAGVLGTVRLSVPLRPFGTPVTRSADQSPAARPELDR